MALAVVERNALLEQVWALQTVRDYVAIVELVGELPLEEYLLEPDLGVTLCYAWYQVGEFDRSLLLIQQLTEVCERRGNTWLSRRRLNCEGLLRVSRSELDEAEPLLQHVLARAEVAGDGQMVTWAHNNLGILYSGRGSWDFALSHFRRAIAAGQRRGDSRHISLCHMNMAAVYLRTDRPSEAQEHVMHALELSRDSGSDAELGHIDCMYANVLLAHGDLSLARAVADQARRRFITINSVKGMGIVHDICGRALMREGRLAEARHSLEEALACYQATGYREVEGFLMEAFATLHEMEGDSGSAIDLLNRAVQFFSQQGNSSEVDRLRARISQLVS